MHKLKYLIPPCVTSKLYINLSKCETNDYSSKYKLIESKNLNEHILNCNNLNISGSKNVKTESYIIACERLNRMLRHTHKNVKVNLINAKANFRIIAENETITDLPEHNHMKNKKGGYSGKSKNTIDNCRGMRHGSYVFCGEENLLYQGTQSKYSSNVKDIFIHETAHAIMGDGLDNPMKKSIEFAWRNAKNNNLWKSEKKKAYALSNAGEYFAELSMWYFGGHGDFIDSKNRYPSPGPGGLANHDKVGFDILNKIYSGQSYIGTTNFNEVELKSITGFGLLNLRSESLEKDPEKVCISFFLKNIESNSEYEVNWVNYSGEIRWGFRIKKDAPYFKVSTYPGHAWIIRRKEKKPKYILFGDLVDRYTNIKGVIANKTNSYTHI